jgi:galactokinase
MIKWKGIKETGNEDAKDKEMKLYTFLTVEAGLNTSIYVWGQIPVDEGLCSPAGLNALVDTVLNKRQGVS